MISEIDTLITTNKEKAKLAAVEESKKLQVELKKLMNRRVDVMNKLRKKYKVVVEDSGGDTSTDIMPTFK